MGEEITAKRDTEADCTVQRTKPFELKPYVLPASSMRTASLVDTATKPILEIITGFRASHIKPQSSDKEGSQTSYGNASEDQGERMSATDYESHQKVEKIDLDDLRIHRLWVTKMKIWSPILLSNLRSHTHLFDGYDEYGYRSDPGTCYREPYYDLLWSIDTIRRLAQSSPIEPLPGRTEHTKYDNADRAHHFSTLLQFLEPLAQKFLVPAQNRLSSPAPSMPFNLLPWIFKEGTEVYIRPENERDLPIAALVRYITSHPKQLNLHCWRIAASGEAFGRRTFVVSIHMYQSERKLTSLSVFPARFLDAENNGTTRRALIERGRAYYDLVNGGPKEMIHSGKAYDMTRNPSSFKHHGNIVIDHIGALNSVIQPPGEIRHQFDLAEQISDIPEWVFDRSLASEEKGAVIESTEEARGRFELWNIPVDKDLSLTDKHFLIMENMTLAYAIKDKRWLVIDVANLKEVERARDPLSNVIIRKEDIDMIKALSFREKNVDEAWGADFIEGKGRGQIVLLHGPPGVGKTYTVECIAESFSRPLLSLTTANIGVEETDVEKELSRWFLMAERWKAILLIDEADVFLEQRALSDLTRNQLVAVFLRKIEYFAGILFLTTNRIGHIDDAFASRIHVIIGYGKLDDNARAQIWKNFFGKLERDKGGKIIVGDKAMEFVTSGEEMKELQWNGREIRNGLQTAIAIAEYEASLKKNRNPLLPIIVEEAHFRQVMRMSKSFRDYMFSVAREDEAKRALGRKDRNDYR